MKLETAEDPKAAIAAVMAAISNEDWAGAADLLDALLARHPREPVALYLLGLVRFGQNNWMEAEKLLRKALMLAPTQWQVALQLAQTLRALQRPGEAQTLCHQLVAAHPGEVAAWLELGKAQEESGAPAAAEASYRHILERSGDPRVALNLAQLLTNMGRGAEAETLLRRVLTA